MSKQRASNIELLRIVLILMIIILHYLNGGMGGLLLHVRENSTNYYLGHLLESFCIIAVNVFILITGYFSVNKTNISVSKVIRLLLIMIFWGVSLSILKFLFIGSRQSIFEEIKIIAVSSLTQWFVVIYCILYLLIPYINLLINTISKKEFEILLIIGIVFFYVLPTISKVTLVDDGYGITNFIYLYLFGAYIRKYYNNNVSIIKAIFLYLVMTFITTCLSFITTHVWSYATIFNLISSISLFEIFKSLKIDHNIVINKLAIYTFSVYLIDINLQHYLYRTLFHSNQYWNSPLMIVNLIISVFGIYVICIIMDWLRVVLFGKLFSYISSLVKCKIEVKNSSNN